jgi:Leucine-rich repeat (LRR) protein
MQAINIDPLPREDMVLEGGEEGGTVDVVKRRRHIVMASCISFIFLLAIVLGITIPLVVVRNSPSADVTTESNSNTARGGGMKGDELLLSEGGLEDEQTGQFGSDVDLEDVAVTDAPTSENPARDEAIMGVLRTLSGDTVARSATPQNQAANFIINEDPLQMDADSSYLTQRYAVAVLYFSLNGPKWKNQTNLLSGERECEWAGVTCATNSRHIRKIVWSNNTMDGILPEEIGALDRMEHLNLEKNSLDGRIPASIWKNMTRLKFLSLGSNMLSGRIPNDVQNLVNLRELNLDNNLMDGSINSYIGKLSKLETLKLYGNGFTGAIPKELGQLSEARRLDLDDNQLSGEIPQELGYLTKVHTLWLNGNQGVKGPLPEGIFTNMTMLTRLFLGDMSLTGTLSTNIGNLKALEYLQIKNNNLNGTLPKSIGQCTSLLAIEADGNDFVGPLPHSFGDLENLGILYLSGNNFGHGIPSQWGKMTNLTTFVASQANLTGIFYPEFGQWSKLQYLLLDRNAMTESLPPQIGDLTNLTHLYLYGNTFNGQLPSTLGKLTNLREMVIDQNEFTGTLPTELGELKKLVTLFMFQNHLNGTVPAPVCELQKNAMLKNLWADCQDELDCPCCSACCVFSDAYSGCFYMDTNV